MAEYLLLKHYRCGPAPAVDWTPAEVDAHVQFMGDFAAWLEVRPFLVGSPTVTE